MTKVNVIMLPFAGGSQNSYKAFMALRSKELNFQLVELPGRGRRIGELPLSDIHEMVEDLFLQLKPSFASRYVFYGHSMGALLAYLLTNKIVKERLTLPEHLFISAKAGPKISLNGKGYYQLPNDEFRIKLFEYGGLPDIILNNPKFLDLFIPYIKADFKAVETYNHVHSVALDVPISVILGSSDNITIEQGERWKEETNGMFDLRLFEGGHFFIFNHTNQLMEYMLRQITKTEVTSGHTN